MGARLTPAGITAQGAATGRALRDVGVNVDLAPVCDVAAKGGNVFADGRAVGTTVAAASVGCTSFARGLRAGRVAAAAEHFPGFGRARMNTDAAVVRVGAPRAVLEREMAPFRDAISARVPMVMVASAIYPALSAKPALLDAGVVVGMLRRDLGFRGVTVTDAIDTPALSPWGGTHGASAAAAAADMDLIIVSGTEAAARAASRGVVGALGNRRITRAAAMASLARVIDLRRSLAR